MPWRPKRGRLKVVAVMDAADTSRVDLEVRDGRGEEHSVTGLGATVAEAGRNAFVHAAMLIFPGWELPTP